MDIHETLYRIELTLRYGDPIVDRLKEFGCKWDGQARVWWVGRRHPNAQRIRDLVHAAHGGRMNFARECERRRSAGLSLKIPYSQRHLAKQNGGIWDNQRKLWLMPTKASVTIVRAQLVGHSEDHREAA